MPIGESLSEQKLYANVLLWGREGTGKTTDALRMTELHPTAHVVAINAEGGIKRDALVAMGVDASRVEIWPPENAGPGYITYDRVFDEVLDPMAEALAEDPESYVGLLVDSFSELARIMLGEAAEISKEKARRLGKDRDRFLVTLEDHGVASVMMRDMLRTMRDLPCHLFLTALERRDVDPNTSMVTYGPALPPAVGTDTLGLVDVVGFCQVETIGDEDFRTATFTTSVLRRAKDRFGVFPPKIGDPFADRIIGYIDGSITRETDPVRARILAAAAGDETPEEAPDEATEAAEAPEPAPRPKKAKKAPKKPSPAAETEPVGDEGSDEEPDAALAALRGA